MKRALPALAALSLCILLSALGTSIANVALPTIAEAFDAPIQHVQWIVLAYLLAITTLIVSVGRLADLGGRRRMLLGGIALFIGASIACGFAPTLGALIAARAAQGLGAAAMMALAMPFVADTVAKEKSGSAMGLLGTTSAIGTSLGPSLGGFLIAELGWRAVFLAPVPLALVAALLAWRTLPADSDVTKKRERFDAAGTLLLAVTLAAYALAMAGHMTLLFAALVGLAMFVRVEAKAASPLVRLDLFSDRARTAAFATNALVTTVVMATLVVGPFYLAGALALDAARVGLVLSVGPIVAALAGVPSGAIVDRFGARRMTIAALAIMVTGCVALSLMPARFGIPGYVAPLVTITAGYALFQAANNTAVMADARADQRGVISGMLNLSRNLGLITGASLMGAIFGAARNVASGMRVTFAVAAGLVGIALGIAYGVAKMARVRWSTAAVLLLACAASASEPIALGRKASLTIGAESRVRYDSWNNRRLTLGNDHKQGLFRGTLSADLRFNPSVRLFGEIGTGQVSGRRADAGANFQNAAALQQLLVEVRGTAGSTQFGAVAGRQEFADGPRQLISVGDGPNLHRSWNGVRAYAQRGNARIGVFDFRATQLDRGSFDDAISDGERLRGVHARVVSPNGNGSFDPFWIRSTNRRVGDERDTLGVRARGSRGAQTYDWTIAGQTGRASGHGIDAWGVFLVQSHALSASGWTPRLTSRIDVASGAFNPLYASSSYLGESQFLRLRNLLMMTSGITLSPTPRTSLSLEHSDAWRFTRKEPVYADATRAYAGTESTRDRRIRRLLRLTGSWQARPSVNFSANYERFIAGEAMEHGQLPSGSYGYVAATYRY